MSTEPDLPIVEEVGAELHRLFLAAETRPSRWGRLRSRSLMRGRVLLPLATLLVTAGAATAAVITLTGGSKPLTGGGYFACPPRENYMADDQTGVVYPSNYPTYKGSGLEHKGWLRSIRCFGSLQNAIDGGYTLAGLPQGYSQLRGVYFTRSDAYVRATCSRAQRATKAPVFCPQVLPQPWADRSNEARYGGEQPDCPGQGCEAPILSVNGDFVNPNWYTAENESTVGIWAVSTGQESAPATVGLVGCPTPRLRHRTSFRGHPAGWYTCPDPDSMGIDTLFQWTIGPEHYGVMVSNDTDRSRQLTAYIVAHLVELQPRT